MHEDLIYTLYSKVVDQPRSHWRVELERICSDPALIEQVIVLLDNTPASEDEMSGYFEAFHDGALVGGRFKILRTIGEGGMARVFEADDTRMRKAVALKTILPQWVADPAVLKRFVQEVSVTQTFNHPNICRVFDIDEHVRGGETFPFFTMELLKGQPLNQRLVQSTFPRNQALGLLRQIAGGLDYAHSQGIVHRDLKPDNIFLVPQLTGDIRAVIVDFGVALDRAVLGARTLPGEKVFQNLDYAAPEQRPGARVDRTVDIYALGLIAHEMITGGLPARGSPFPLRRLLRPRATIWDRAIAKCLREDPARRWQTAGSFVDALEFPVWLPGAAVALVLAGGSAAYWRPWTPLQTNAIIRQVGATDVAVLPVIGDPTDMTSGLLDALARRLDGSGNVRVTYGSSVGKIRITDTDSSIARRLGVTFLVQGNAQVEGDDFTITITIKDGRNGKTIWTQEYRAQRQGLPGLAGPMYRDVAKALNAPQVDRPVRAYDYQAYSLYIKGRDLLRDAKSLKDIEKALASFESAMKKDPQFAIGAAGIVDTYLAMYRETKDATYSKLALNAAEKARALGEDVPEVLLSLGTLYSTVGRNDEAVDAIKKVIGMQPSADEAYRRLGRTYQLIGKRDLCVQAFETAVRLHDYWNNHAQLGNAHIRFGENHQGRQEFLRTTELEPNYAYGFQGVADADVQIGRFAEAIEYYQRALSIQKHPSTYSNLGTAYFYRGEYDRAIASFKKAIELQPKNDRHYGNLADAYRATGNAKDAQKNYTQAISLVYKSLDVNPRDAEAQGRLALYYARTGKLIEAGERIRTAGSLDSKDAALVYWEAIIDTLANRKLESIRRIQEALEKGACSIEQVRQEPDFAVLRSEPTFQKLLGNGAPRPK